VTVWAHVRAGLVVATSEGDTAPVDDRSTLVQLEPSDGVALPGFTYDGVVFTPAGPDADEDAARERHWAAIKVERDRRRAEGGFYVASVDKWFHSDDTSRIQQIGLVLMGAAVPPVQWKTMDGSFATMSQALAAAIFATAAASDQALFAAAETARSAMAAAPLGWSIASVAWPPIFGEA